MSARRAGGVDEATRSANQAEESNTGTQPKTNSILGSQDDLLNLARGMGHLIGEPTRESQEASVSEEDETREQVTDGSVTEEEAETSTDETEEQTEETTEVEGEAETEEEDGEHKSIDEQIAEAKARGEKPAWYLTRIAKATRQKNEERERAEEAEEIARGWQQRAEAAENQLATGSGPQPTRADPLANVWTGDQLQNKKSEAEFYLAWCERNRDGGDFPDGKDSNGDPKTKYLDRDAVVDLKMGCEKVLREGIPQRANYLQRFVQAENETVKLFPELKDRDNQFTKNVLLGWNNVRTGQVLKDPNLVFWLACMADGYRSFQARQSKNGAGKKTDAIARAAKTKIAPTPARARGITPRSSDKSGNTESARKNLQEKGDSASAEKLLESLGVGGGGRAKKREVVE